MPIGLQGGILIPAIQGIKMERLPENKIVWGFLYIVIVHPGDCEWNSNHFKQAEELLDHLDLQA